jgi:hypothetical protein
MARYLRPETLVLTVTSSSRENLLHESCTDRIYRLAISRIRHVGSWRSWKYESAIDATMCGGPLLLLIEKGDRGNTLDRDLSALTLQSEKEASSSVG